MKINKAHLGCVMAAAGELFPVDEHGLPRVAELSADDIRTGFRLFFLNKQKVRLIKTVVCILF